MKPNILAVLPGLVPSTIINVTTPLVSLHKANLLNVRVTLEMFVKDKDINWSDLLVLCRNVEPAGIRWLSKLLESKKPFIYDIDDNFFEVPVDTIAGRYHASPERLVMLGEYLRHANLVRVYSEPMLERVKSLNHKVIKVNGFVDWKLISSDPKALKQGPVKIVYTTSRVDDNLVEIFKPALKKILEKYANQIEVFFLGHNPAEFKSYSNVFFRSLNLNYENYLHNFSSAGYDIGLAPLFNDVFHRSKTNLKVREFGACRIAGIYSDVDTYSTSVIHNKNGLLVKNTPEAWYNALSTLIENRDLRLQIQEQAYRYAREHFSRESFIRQWHSQISEVLNRSVEKIEPATSLYPPVLSEGASDYREPSLVIKPDREPWLAKVFVRFTSGVKMKGITFFFLYIRIKVQMLWMWLKLKFTLH